jgi:hypothetical protein
VKCAGSGYDRETTARAAIRHIRAFVAKQLHAIFVASPCSHDERCIPSRVFGVNLSAVLDQQLHGRHGHVRRRVDEGSGKIIAADHVQIDPRRTHEQLKDFGLRFLRGGYDWTGESAATQVGIRAVLQQTPDNFHPFVVAGGLQFCTIEEAQFFAISNSSVRQRSVL